MILISRWTRQQRWGNRSGRCRTYSSGCRRDRERLVEEIAEVADVSEVQSVVRRLEV